MRKRIQSFKYALTGLYTLFRDGANAKIHAASAIAVIICGVVWQVSATEWALLTLAIAMVMAAEALNTALEHLTDLASPQLHPLAGKAKDVAAAGVLLTAIGAAIVGLIVFWPKIFGG